LELGGLLPGITIKTSATDFAPIEQLRLQKLQGDTWHLFGEIISAEVGG
jgi:branched-chain amino acid transport system substrate-binding protein